MNRYSDLERQLLNDYQHGLPLSPAPFADIAEQLGVDEATVLDHLSKLQQQGVISRVGAVFRPNRVGVSTLAAMAVPRAELETVAEIVNAFGEVNHNYEREHEFNLWFVVTADNDEHLTRVLQDIEQCSGYAVLNLPMIDDYFIDLGFELKWT
jgi:DNA-binding Lrp family transcriptional regulator